MIAFILIQILSAFQGVQCFEGKEKYFAGQLDRASVIDSADTITSEKYPDADTVDVDKHYWIKYNEDGTYIQWHEQYVKILNENGKRQYSDVTSWFSVYYNITSIRLVEIIKTDGTTITIDVEKNSKVAVDSSLMDDNIYDPNEKYLQVNLPHLDIGDVVHFIIFDDYFKTKVPNTWSEYINFETTNPIQRYEVTIIAPKKMPLKNVALRSEIPGTMSHSVDENDDHIIYHWIAKEVPMAFPEQDMPPLYTQTQRLLVSTIDGWESISRWYWNLSEPQIARISSDTKNKVSQITEGIQNPQKKIEALFKWVSQEIRYLGLTTEKEAPGYEPHPVRKTFERRAGVCRDKAALLTAMLRVAGIEAYPVLIHSSTKMDSDVPQPFFDHAITAVREPGGSYLLMDSTEEATRNLLPAYLNDKSYLVATPEGDKLRTTSIEPAEQHMMLINTIGELKENGKLLAKTTFQFNGINDSIYREYLAEKTFFKRLQYVEGVINSNSFSATISDFEITPKNLMDTSVPLRISFSLESDDIQILRNGSGMLKLPFIGTKIGLVHLLTDKFGLKNRKYPLITDNACGIRETFKLKLSDGMFSSVSLPKFPDIDNEGTTWRRTVSLEDGVLAGENIFKMNLLEYNPEQYKTLRDTLGIIELNRNKMMIFTVPETSETLVEWGKKFNSDALVLEEINEYELKDEHSWKETKYLKLKILTYAGKKRYSDIKIRYNPTLESVKIKKAKVIMSSGEIIKINSDEMNIMDADWVGDAPRYPAGKILVVNFPAVDIGSVIEYKIIKTKKNRPFFTIDGSLSNSGNPFYRSGGKFRYYEPILKKTLRIKSPKNLDLKIIKADHGIGIYNSLNHNNKHIIQEKRKQNKDYEIIEFTASKVEPVVRERNLPPWYSFNPVVFVSSGSLEEYSNYIREALLKNVSLSPLIKGTVRKITKNKTNRLEIIKSIRNYVARNNTYVSLSYNKLPISSISKADVTLKDGYGNSIDQAILLFSLLSAAGFEPEFVLSTYRTKLRNLCIPINKTPSYNWFKKVLVKLNTENGYIYMNDTTQYSMIGTTYSDGYQGLVLETGKIEVIKAISTEFEDRTESQYDIALKSDGSAQVRVKNVYYGTGYGEFRERCEKLTPESRRRLHLKLAAELNQRAIPIKEYITNYNTYPGTEIYTVQINNFSIPQEGYYYLELPGLRQGFRGASRSKRVNPFYKGGFDKETIRVNLEIPDKYKSLIIAPPKSTHLRMNGAGGIVIEAGDLPKGISTSTEKKHRKYFVEQRIDYKPFMILPDEYPTVRKFHRLLAHPSYRTMLFK